MIPPLRIVVADDHPIFLRGLVQSLSARPEFAVCGEAGDADAAVTAVADLKPDLVILDLSMPGGGLSAIGRILEIRPSQNILILTASEADEDILAALSAGAAGYALKGLAGDALAEAIHVVSSGESYAPPRQAARLLAGLAAAPIEKPSAAVGIALLTERELSILRHVSRGASNKMIARELDVEEKTIKNHMTRVMAKLGVASRLEAALSYLSQTRDQGPRCLP